MVKLNPAQQAAVDHGDGPLLILAGAGSGKTRVITHRIARLVKRGADPESIVAVSFTNKAAGEMAERIVPLVGGKKARALRMSTFHRFGLGFMREEAKVSGLDGKFTIFDQADSMGVVKEILRETYKATAGKRRFDTMSILARISNWKSAMKAPDEVPSSNDEYDGVAREVYPEYEERLKVMRALDFDDLVCRPVRVLREEPEVRARWQQRIRHLLVDEFQDTSEVQLELVKLLANEKRNVCVVGDDDQSIYSWRGANVGNILEFEQHFPGTTLIKLETNYRSRAPILEVANAVIAAGQGRRHAKSLRAARDGGDAVRVVTCESPRHEAQFVAREINELRSDLPMKEVAVLYRSNLQARLIEEELTASNVPYRLFGGQQFFDRKEVKDVAAYLRVVVNPWDEISLRRILNYPARGVGARSVQHIEGYAKQHQMPFAKACFLAERIEGIPDAAKAAIRNLNTLLSGARQRLEQTGSLHGAAVDLVETIKLRRALDESAEGGAEGDKRYQNVLHLLKWLERYEAKAQRDRKSLQDFLQRVTLNGDDDREEKTSGVTLTTLHAAKGLEFKVVFLIGCIEGQIPHSRTTDPKASEAAPADLEEERRLFYVGITRAQDRLYLTSAKKRVLRGKEVEVTPSRYMDDLPAEHIKPYEREDQKDYSHEELGSMVRDLLRKTRARNAEAQP